MKILGDSHNNFTVFLSFFPGQLSSYHVNQIKLVVLSWF